MVLSSCGISGRNFDGKIVIINHQNRYYAEMLVLLLVWTGRYKRNTNIFTVNEFMDKYISIFAMYVSNKVYSKHNCFIITTICNLNCKYCLNFTPYNKQQQHIDLCELKDDVDIYFHVFDRVGLFHVSGGEPLLYPNFNEIIQFIAEKYREKIEVLGISTNGAVVPSDETCEIMKKYNVHVECDDYRRSVQKTKYSYIALINKLRKYGISYHENKTIVFFKTFPPVKSCHDYSDQSLIYKFDKCVEFFNGQELKNKHLYSCFYSKFAINAGLIDETLDDYYDLEKFSGSLMDKKILIEFRLGYNNKGYVDFCKYCNGTPNINPLKKSKGAEQAKGKLNWDINNPTYLEK
jgi:organic radical activating enzyme